MNTTEHVTNKGQGTTKISNKLIDEKSPYLLQHAYNPVKWYPWGDEAFTKAREENKPIFLSIGYSCCHWCHVMAHESFEDNEIAEYLNAHFISIKVDREERPDIDSVYMAACVSLTGDGGWPLSIFMSPDKKPFYAGTYFPKNSNYQMPGFRDLARAVKNAWENSRGELLQSGEELTNAIKIPQKRKESADLKELTEKGAENLKKYFDKENGGFGRAPKFPTPHNLMFLLKYSYYYRDKESQIMAEKTLDALYRGGIYDHIGYGFSRYSTDSIYLVPHFEKMLYDNALLASAYLESYQITGKEHYREIAERILAYVDRELTDKLGGFYCAQDADSEGEEGKYYVLRPEEVIAVLGEDDGNYFNQYFDITGRGNFEGANIPNRIQKVELLSSYKVTDDRIDRLCSKMYEYRRQRTKLHKDDKMLASWNGLMIMTYAKAYQILGVEEYLKKAVNGVGFIEEHLIEKDRLKVHFRDGAGSGEGHLEDYAFYAMALLTLYECSFEVNYLDKALKITEKMMELFFDSADGGFFLYAKDGESLIYRPKVAEDNAIPSGNSAAAYVLKKLSALTGNVELVEAAALQLKYLSEVIDYPISHCFTLSVLLTEVNVSRELVCVTEGSVDKGLKQLLKEQYLPDLTVVLKNRENQEELSRLIPFTREYPLENRTAYYLCENRKCRRPVYTIEELQQLLKGEA